MEDWNRSVVPVRAENQYVPGTTERAIAPIAGGTGGDDAPATARRCDPMFVHHHDHVGAFDVRFHAPADDGVRRRPDTGHHHEAHARHEREGDHANDQSTETEHDRTEHRWWALLSTACPQSSHAFPNAPDSVRRKQNTPPHGTSKTNTPAHANSESEVWFRFNGVASYPDFWRCAANRSANPWCV